MCASPSPEAPSYVNRKCLPALLQGQKYSINNLAVQHTALATSFMTHRNRFSKDYNELE